MDRRPIADKWIKVDESTMTMGVPEILLEIRRRKVARDPALTKKLLELPAVHPCQRAGLAE